MAFTQFTNLDFNQIKLSIREYLRSNSNFTDFDFEGSNLSVLVDTLAYNTYLTAYNTNMVVNETFIDSATLRENVVSLARNIGYLPLSRRSAKATISFRVSDIGSTSKTATLKAGIVCSGDFNNTSYIFSIPEDFTVGVSNGEALFENVEIYEGTFLRKRFIVNTVEPNQKYILPNPYIDTSTIRVSVKNTVEDTTSEQYNYIDNIIGINSESQIFLVQEVSDEKYELFFGDGVFGKKLSNNNEVNVTYIVTNGIEGNGATNFAFSGLIITNDNIDLSGRVESITTIESAQNGDNIQSIDSVRYYAPRLYSTQYRAVTALDYEALLPTIYPNIESVTAYGGEEVSPPQFGKVFLAVKPKNADYLSESTKETLLQNLKKYSVAGIQPEFVDINVLYVELDSSVYFNTNLVNSVGDLKTKIVNSLESYSTTTDLSKFGGRFKYSKVTSVIDSTSNAITSNITKIKIRRDVGVILNESTQYLICFENRFNVTNQSFNIRSTGFRINGDRDIVYISDTPNPDLVKGKLFLFSLDDNNNVVTKAKNIGDVNYTTGEINIDNINVSSTLLPNNIIEIEALPYSNDIIAKKSIYLKLDVGKSKISMVKDLISSGENVSGSRFIAEPSYFSEEKIRV